RYAAGRRLRLFTVFYFSMTRKQQLIPVSGAGYDLQKIAAVPVHPSQYRLFLLPYTGQIIPTTALAVIS
ncbi:MAG: hypothetical protein LBD48_09165, partial [Treponema sp.]|nr:hypothetical protein [Treponema sp.]